MQERTKQLNTIIRLTGVASLMLFVGATARPAVSTAIPAAATSNKLVARVAAPAASTDAELMHEATTAVAVISPSTASLNKKLRTIRMEVTAYCPCQKCCGENAEGITASGRDVSYNHSRFVAADTDVLPFGTKLIIPGYHGKPVEVIDRGGAIKGNKLDLFYPTHEEALQWGRQWVDVVVVE
jgi:3D (Asp-Asp-Asp) domain-containing protein